MMFSNHDEERRLILLVDDRGNVLQRGGWYEVRSTSTSTATFCNRMLEANVVETAVFEIPRLLDIWSDPERIKAQVHREEHRRLVTESRAPRLAPLELEARHGYAPAPRLPCYRGTRTR